MRVGILLACSMATLLRAQQQTVPDPVKTSITVTERITAETPANITEESAKELQLTPGVDLDDRLRRVPGFSLFRRSSGVVANPTTQGVSLRGIGSTGASRTLVLWDGVPMNDPFGGWVYWTRFPVEELRSVEISRGASTSVFGDLAMGGAIGLFTREASQHHFDFGYQAGNRNSEDVWIGYSDLWPHFALSGSGRAFGTDGYYVVPDYVRGKADRRAGVKFVTADTRVDWFGASDRLFAAFGMLAEERQNGTTLTQNSTGLGTASLHYVHEFKRDEVSFIGFRTQDQFHSTYSSVSLDRNTERLVTRQTVPSNGNGADLLWRHRGAFWNVVTGADVDQDRGFSIDSNIAPVTHKVSGGTLLQHGEFVQSDVRLGGVQLFGGARHQDTGQGRQFFSPSGGLAYGVGPWRARGSVYRAYRAPTLNELYRDFRVGNTLTLSNGALRPETLFGAEVGADYLFESGSIRVTAFRNTLANLITNVTLTSTPALITRQRRNSFDSLSRGIEVSINRRWHEWRGELAYLLADSRYVTGPRIPQVARHQGSGTIAYERGGTVASVGVRGYSSQFDDDLNQFRLPGYTTVQATFRQRLMEGLTASVELENALARLYYTGFTPTPTIGAPRLVRVGFRWNGKL